ncbi:MAG: CoA transferase [Candidatus Nanopelagicales bacterium]
MTGALDGIVVADFSRVLAGPYATMLLADLGADVIKVERPGPGDETRGWGPPWADVPDGGRESTYFLGVNRNKTSAWIDLATDDGRAEARKLIERADVVVENFAPGTMDRFGLGYEGVSISRPHMVWASITGFGAGDGRDLPGYDLLVQAVGGLMSITGPEPAQPTKVGVAVVDVITGLHCAVGILAALQHRSATGRGQRVEVNLLSSLLSGLVNQSSAYIAAGEVPGILGNQHPSIAPYEAFDTADKPMVIAVGNDAQFATLCEVLGLEGVADDERYTTNSARVTHRGSLHGLLSSVLSGRPADEWFERLAGARIPAGPINDIAAAVELAQRLGLEPVVDADGVPTIANPISLSATPPTYRLRPPPRAQR